MSDSKSKISTIVIDTIEKVSSQKSRSASTVERVAKLDIATVDKEVIALQLTKNSRNGYKYTEESIKFFSMLYEDSRSNVGITKAQTEALLDDQAKNRPYEVVFSI